MPLVAFFQKKPRNSLKLWNFLLHLEFEGKLSKILYDMSMKMMIRDNFVHGDLHGGNILYSMSDDHVTVLDAGIATSLDKRTFAPFGNSAETRRFSPFFLFRVVSKSHRSMASPILKVFSCTLFVRVKLIRWSSICSDSTKQNWIHVSSLKRDSVSSAIRMTPWMITGHEKGYLLNF